MTPIEPDEDEFFRHGWFRDQMRDDGIPDLGDLTRSLVEDEEQ